MFNADVLTFQEFKMNEPLPLARLHEAVFEFLRDRDDAVVFGAQAVNAYVEDPRMTQDIDLMSTRAEGLAEDLRAHLHGKFHIALRVRSVASGRGFRLFQVSKEGNRHLVDLRAIDVLPAAERVAGILVLAAPDLIASKVFSYHRRMGQPKAGTDWRDLAVMLIAFPDLKQSEGEVAERLRSMAAESEVFALWQSLVAQDIREAPEDEEFWG
jgi:hypothetical protein